MYIVACASAVGRSDRKRHDFVRACVDILTDPQKARYLSENGKKAAITHLDTAVVAAQMAAKLTSIVSSWQFR